MSEHSQILSDQARFQIDDRVRQAAANRAAKKVRRRHRLARQLGTVADRLDV